MTIIFHLYLRICAFTYVLQRTIIVLADVYALFSRSSTYFLLSSTYWYVSERVCTYYYATQRSLCVFSCTIKVTTEPVSSIISLADHNECTTPNFTSYLNFARCQLTQMKLKIIDNKYFMNRKPQICPNAHANMTNSVVGFNLSWFEHCLSSPV